MSRLNGALVTPCAGLRPGFFFAAGDVDMAVVVIPGRDLVAPPQLARDAPVLDVVQPLVVGRGPVFRNHPDFTVRDFFQRDCGNRLAREVRAFGRRLAHRHEPLVGQHRLDHHAGAVAARHHQLVRLDRFQQAQRLEVGHDLLARDIAVHAAVFLGSVVVDLGVERQDADLRQLMALAHRIVVEVMRRRDLDAAGAEGLVDVVVGDDRDFAIGERQLERLADQMHVALVGRIDRHRDVAQHGFRTRGGDRQMAAAIGQRVADVPHRTVLFLGHDFEVGHRGAQHRVPVDQALAAIDQALFEQSHEHFGHGLRQPVVHREVFAAPVGRGAQAAHLAGDGGAGLFFPFPHFFDEFFAAQVMARNLLRIELPFDHDLGGDAGMVGAGNPRRVEAAHAVVARQAIHDGLVEGMPHVQGAGHVGRRQLDAERRFAGVGGGAEIPALFPFGAPEFFYVGGVERFG